MEKSAPYLLDKIRKILPQCTEGCTPMGEITRQSTSIEYYDCMTGKKVAFRLELYSAVKQRLCNLHTLDHGLRTPNEGINQRYLKNWADVADNICCRHT